MRVLINGLPHFSEILVKDLKEFDASNTYVFCDTYTSKWGKLKYMLNLPFSKVVISSNGVSDPSVSLSLALKWKKKMIMQWHGSDVIIAMDRLKKGTIHKEFIQASEHLISAPWFREELKGLVDNCVDAPISYTRDVGNDQVYERFSVITYFPEGKEVFYGWQFIQEFAQNNPDVEVKVVGNTGKGLKASKNVSFLGWIKQEELMEEMRKTPVFLRLTEHDGKSVMVSQALGVGCEVVWTNRMGHCHYFSRQEKLEKTIHEIHKLVKTRNMNPNQESIQFAQESLSREFVMKHFVAELKKIING